MNREAVRRRFDAKCQPTENGCMLWTGQIDKDGYGTFTDTGRRWRAHRWIYEQCFGPMPKGLVTDHKCRVRNCVNPSHLEAVTIRENVLRGDTLPAREVAKAFCLRGHAYTEANTYRDPKGKRSCRVCRKHLLRKFYAHQRGLTYDIDAKATQESEAGQ
jgi:hypothetical protein